MRAAKPSILSASTLIGDKVFNRQGEDLGKLEEIMLDHQHGRIAYAVLSFGGFLGIGDKLFAVPWTSLELHPDEHRFILDADKQMLENAPGFDKEHWPGTEDYEYMGNVYRYYSVEPYWDFPELSRPDISSPATGRTPSGL